MGFLDRLRGSEAWRYLKKNKKFWVSLAIVLFVVGLGLFGPYMTKYTPKTPTGMPMQPPSPQHPFGTDYFGYDVFAEVVYGIRVSLSVGVVAALIATFIGVVLGMIAGLRGGLTDAVIDTVINIMLSIPPILIMILLAIYMGRRGIWEMGLIIGILSWQWTARAVRSQVSAIRVSDYIAASYFSGNSFLKVLAKDIFPNIASYVFLSFVIQLSTAIMTVVTLEFFGLGASEWSLGAIIQLAVLWGGIPLGLWWWFLFPGIIIVALIASLYILVVSLEEVFNPRLRRE